MPRLPDEYLVWCGAIYPPEHFQKMYDVDEVRYTDTLADFLGGELSGDLKLHLMSGVNSDSGTSCVPASFEGDDRVSAEYHVFVLVSFVVCSFRRRWTHRQSSTQWRLPV
jgi:hypothetical protein